MVEFYCPKCSEWSFENKDITVVAGEIRWTCPHLRSGLAHSY